MKHTKPQVALSTLREIQHFGAREWNPIVVREGRARWRGSRAYWLALAYASFLAFVLWWSYSSSNHGTQGSSMDSMGAAAKLGHELFGVLCYAQVCMWLLMSPIMTSSALSGEREKGLLEGLLLSRLSPTQIVRGKMLSALGLITLLILAALPVTSVCFLLGGVSPGEFVGSLAIQISTAVCGASIGLAVSANHRRSTSAASGAIGGMLLWLMGTGFAVCMTGANWAILTGFIASANPLTAMWVLTDSASVARELSGSWLTHTIVASGYAWLVSVASMSLIAAWRLHAACLVLERSPETFDQLAPPTDTSVTSTCTARISSDTAYQQWKRTEGEAPFINEAPEQRHHEVPLLNHILFGNALMRRELMALWRRRRLSDNAEVGLCTALVCLGMILLYLLAVLTEPSASNAKFAWGFVLFVYGLVATIFCALHPALSISNEREGGSWQELRLTSLSSLQITQAKVGAPLIAVLGYGAPAWLYMVAAAHRAEIGMMSALHSVLLLIILVQVTSWSVLCGARARSSATSFGWVVGGLAFAWAGIPLLMSLFNISLAEVGTDKLILMLHPACAFEALNTPDPDLALVIGVQAGLAALLFKMALAAVERSQRAEKISTSRTS